MNEQKFQFLLNLNANLIPLQIKVKASENSDIELSMRREISSCSYSHLKIEELNMRFFLPLFHEKTIHLRGLVSGSYHLKNGENEIIAKLIIK